MERLSLITTAIEKRSGDPDILEIIGRVKKIVIEKPDAFLHADLSDCRLQREVLTTHATLTDGREIGIEIVGEHQEQNIEINVFDPKLSSGTPRYKSFCYRVNIFGGEVAQQYRGSPGYTFSQGLVDLSGTNDIIISDNWAETNLTRNEVLDMLQAVQKMNAPSFQQKTTASGTPRYKILGK